jgi:hypothetical protein
MLNLDGDLPRHLLMGKYILQNQSIPTTELFIYPYLNQPYVSHEWLTDVFLYIIHVVGGWAGLVLFAALLLAGTFTLLYEHLSTRLRLRLPILFLVAWGAIATSLNWAIRPHLISMLILSFWLIWTDDLRRGRKIPLWLFPIVMLLWSNLHGEFIAGILVLIAYAFGWLLEYLIDRSRADLTIGRKLWMALVSSGIASLFNPSGAGPWVSILGFVNNEYLMSRMVEANAPDFQRPEMQILFSLLVGSILLLAMKKARLSFGQAFLLTGFSAMSLMAIRNIHLYGIVAPFVLAETLDGIRSIPLVDRIEQTSEDMEAKRGMRIAWITAPVLLLSLAVFLLPGLQNMYQLKEPMFPIRALEWLKKNPQEGRMLNNLNWGGYLGLHLWPEQLPFIDSMSDTSGEVTREYETLILVRPGWQALLEKYEVNWAILPPAWQLTAELSVQGWRTVYQDQIAVVLLKE